MGINFALFLPRANFTIAFSYMQHLLLTALLDLALIIFPGSFIKSKKEA